MMDAVSADKLSTKELKIMLTRLKSMDLSPQQGLSGEQLQVLLGKFISSYGKDDVYCC